jgi:hypothetical protein
MKIKTTFKMKKDIKFRKICVNETCANKLTLLQFIQLLFLHIIKLI